MNKKRMKRMYSSFDLCDPAPLSPEEEKSLLQTTNEDEAWAVVSEPVHFS